MWIIVVPVTSSVIFPMPIQNVLEDNVLEDNALSTVAWLVLLIMMVRPSQVVRLNCRKMSTTVGHVATSAIFRMQILNVLEENASLTVAWKDLTIAMATQAQGARQICKRMCFTVDLAIKSVL
mmetsp:Transcript_12709/g.19692  ORF Transcript_12709/g.19692 Transcript_12709/m.19692 type:complete len:123 (-) Transcript_12709:350-718(-)